MKSVLAVFLSLFLAACAALPTPTPVQEPVRINTFSQLRQATYQLIGDEATCSAVVIAPEKVLTAAHCDQPGMKVDGKPATSIRKNETADLMLLFVDGLGCPCVPVAKELPKVDQRVFTIGFPLGLGKVMTEGRMQELTNPNPEFAHYMLVTSPVVFGNSGGPVFAMNEQYEYRVVGVVSALAVASLGFIPNIVPHLGFAVNTDVINGFLPDGLRGKRPDSQ